MDTPYPKNFPPKDYSTKKDSSTRKDSSTKKEEKEPVVYYPNDEILNQAFLNFLDMRKENKKPAKTEKAIELLMKKLQKLSTVKDDITETEYMDNNLAIKIVEQSIERTWLGFFPLKEDGPQQKGIDWDNV